MKLILSILLTSVLAFAMGLFLPWWTIALAAFISALLIGQRPLPAFAGGFVAVFALWAVLSWGISAVNDHILAPKMASILPLGGSVPALIFLTATIGGVVAGFGALTASFLVTRPQA